MYNTLKEIQNSLSDKDFNKYVGKLSGKTAEEIMETLKLDNIEISIEAAKECANCLKEVGAVSDEELENITGGGCGSDPDPKYKKGQRFKRYFSTTRNYRYYTIEDIRGYNSDKKSYLYIVKPDNSDNRQERYLDTEDDIVLI